MDALELLEKIRDKLKEPKYEKGRRDRKVVTWVDFTKLINEILEEENGARDSFEDNY